MPRVCATRSLRRDMTIPTAPHRTAPHCELTLLHNEMRAAKLKGPIFQRFIVMLARVYLGRKHLVPVKQAES